MQKLIREITIKSVGATPHKRKLKFMQRGNLFFTKDFDDIILVVLFQKRAHRKAHNLF